MANTLPSSAIEQRGVARIRRTLRTMIQVAGCVGLTTLHAGAADGVPETVEFNRDVRPILSDNCFYCHGPDASHRKGKLRLDVREQALAREAFVPGKPAESELVLRIRSTFEDEVMPPP